MDELIDRVADLAVKYLMAETRDHRGVIDNKKQANVLVDMISCDDVKDIFSFIDKNNWREMSYRTQLDNLFQNRGERALEVANRGRTYIFEKIVQELIEKTEQDTQTRHSAREHLRLKKQVEELSAQLEFGKSSKDVTLWDRLNSRVNLPYLVILFLALVLVGGLAVIGITAKMTVNVDFNIGEIVGGLLVGTGAAAAGISYATRNRGENDDNDE